MFLADVEWQTIPFLSEGSTTPIHSLLNHGCVLPRLLGTLDDFKTNNPERDISIAEKLSSELQALRGIFQEWERQFSLEHHNTIYWPIPSSIDKYGIEAGDSQNGMVFPTSLHFPSILTANIMSHYWAFQVIVLSSMEELNSLVYSRFRVKFLDDLALSRIQLETFEAAKLICQSFEFQILPEMKLFGPAAVFFPLKYALEIFRVHPFMVQYELWCEKFVDHLVNRGLVLAKYRVDSS